MNNTKSRVKEGVIRFVDREEPDKSEELKELALNPRKVLGEIPRENRKDALRAIFPLLVKMSDILQKYKEPRHEQEEYDQYDQYEDEFVED